MGTLARAGLLLLLALGLHQSPGLKCGIRVVDLKSKKTVVESGFVSKILSWTDSAVGRHPRQVSLKLGGRHFCGRSSIQDVWVVTAGHCLADLHEKEFEGLTVTAGEYNLFQRPKQEHNIPVSKVIIHPEFNIQGYMSSDIVLLYLKPKVKFDYKPQMVILFGESRRIPYPCSKEDNYSHNWYVSQMVMNILGKREFEQTICILGTGHADNSPFTLRYSDSQSKECRDVLPSSLLTETTEAIVTLVSDADTSGSGFELSLTALQNSQAGSVCGIVAILVESGTIHRARYSYLRLSNVRCHWFICAPEKHIMKLTFEDFNEFNPNHIYDAVVIYDDPKEDQELDSLNKIGLASPLKTNPISTTKAIPYDVCGIPPFSPQWLSRRIAGGEEACPHCWPWQVSLRFLGDHQCGGAIINPVWILTAAHCVQSKGNPLFWTVVAGDHDITLKESTEQVRRAKHIIVHEDFDIMTYDSDIALIQLSSPLEYNSVVRPVCLPHSAEPLSPKLCAVTGWGSTSGDGGLASRLQQIRVPILEGAACERTYYSAHPGGITDKMLCAGSEVSGGKDFCQGDSGGPLVCRHENGSFVLYGIVSWGAGCVQPWKPGVFARVRVFLDWIQSKIKGPASLQTKNKRKTLTEQKLPPPTPSTDSASGSEANTLLFNKENSPPPVHMDVMKTFLALSQDRGPKGSKTMRLTQSSNQEHMVTCKDVLSKPAGITQLPQYSPRVVTSCPWRLIAPLNHMIRLHVIKLQMKPTPWACPSLLWVYERFGPARPKINSEWQTIHPTAFENTKHRTKH